MSAGGGVAGDSRTILPSRRRSESMIAERSVLPGRVRVSVRLSDGAAFLCVLQPQHTPAIATAHSMNRNIVFLFICMLSGFVLRCKSKHTQSVAKLRNMLPNANRRSRLIVV